MIARSVFAFAMAVSLLPAQVTSDRLLHPEREPQNWLTYSGAYNGNRYSPLDQINRANVRNLQLKWVYHPLYAGGGQGKMENTPLVVDGVLYTGTQTEIVALDAVTGRQYWRFDRPLDPKAYYNAYMVNKGLAIAGDTLFWATLDCHLYAFDVKNGQVKWEVVMADYRKGYQFNVAPLVVRNMIILGPATNEAGANCWVNAYDVNTGKEIWKFYTNPTSADQPESKTWSGDAWKHGGSPIWNGGAYDPETNLTYWGTGNPNPGWSGDVRAPGDNLWSDSVVALDADTGKMKWYFQFTPGDEYDYDATQVPVLTDMDWRGQRRKVMLWANRNGFFYILDRQTGKFLFGKNFVKQNWAVGLDENGRPVKDPGHWPKPKGGVYTEPFVQGGTNWYPPSFSPRTGLFYIPTWENSGKGTTSPKGDPGPWVEGERYEGTGRDRAADGTVLRGGYLASHPDAAARVAALRSEGRDRGPTDRPPRASPQFKTEDEGYGAIRALDPKTGEKVWDFHMVAYTESGVLSTGGDLVFGGGMDGDFVALDAKTGELLWGVYLGGANASGPISYSVNGKQYIIGTGAGTMYGFTLPN